MRYLYNPSTQLLDDTEDKNFGKKVATTDRQQEEADRLLKIELKKMQLDPDYIPKIIDPEDIKFAMSETPQEEADLQLGMEAIEVLKWLKKNPTKTYKDWLKDKKAMLTEDQKKDPKIIDLTPYLPSFEEEIKKYEEEQKQKDETTLEEFTNRKLRLLAENDLKSGISSLVPLPRKT